MALTNEGHLETVKRIQGELEKHKTDLQGILDEVQDDDEIDDDIKEGIGNTIASLDDLKDDLGGFTGNSED